MKGLIKKIVGALTPTKNEKKATIFYGPDKPKNMKNGDVWFQTRKIDKGTISAKEFNVINNNH